MSALLALLVAFVAVAVWLWLRHVDRQARVRRVREARRLRVVITAEPDWFEREMAAAVARLDRRNVL